jgi:hypothetical protein
LKISLSFFPVKGKQLGSVSLVSNSKRITQGPDVSLEIVEIVLSDSR